MLWIGFQISLPVILFKSLDFCIAVYGGKGFLVSFAAVPQVTTRTGRHIASPLSSPYNTSMVQVKLVPIWLAFVFGFSVRTHCLKSETYRDQYEKASLPIFMPCLQCKKTSRCDERALTAAPTLILPCSSVVYQISLEEPLSSFCCDAF